MKQLITLQDVAEHLGLHVATVRRWVRDGLIPTYKVGQRFVRVDLDEVLAAISQEAEHTVAITNLPEEPEAKSQGASGEQPTELPRTGAPPPGERAVPPQEPLQPLLRQRTPVVAPMTTRPISS